jgi:antitoxin (DNA-binding transcriptional repressor) of toxin-antitoxin stability system
MDVGVHEAKTHLSRLLRRVALGEEIVIRNGKRAMARLVPVEPQTERTFGRDRGRFEIPEVSTSPFPRNCSAHSTDGEAGAALALAEDPANVLLFSAASSWEIAIKWRLGNSHFPIRPMSTCPTAWSPAASCSSPSPTRTP